MVSIFGPKTSRASSVVYPVMLSMSRRNSMMWGWTSSSWWLRNCSNLELADLQDATLDGPKSILTDIKFSYSSSGILLCTDDMTKCLKLT